MLIKALKLAIQLRRRQSPQPQMSDLLKKEAALGAYLFGPVPGGVKRSFVVQDRQTVLWQEGDTMTRYSLEANQITKHQTGQDPELVSTEESRRLLTALRWYSYLLNRTLYPVA